MKLRVGIIGATGYTGFELLRILKNHPYTQIAYLGSRSYSGKLTEELFPFTIDENLLEEIDANKVRERCDILFTALPSGTSYEFVKELGNLKVIDLGADFRFEDAAVYEKWYSKKLVDYDPGKRAYGLVEIFRDRIKQVNVVGNPGCYPTCVLLSLAPILKEGLVLKDEIYVDAKSGVSGAGRKEESEYSFCEIDEGTKAYNPANHRHVPEMEEQIKKICGKRYHITFVPHLVPMVRGILSTVYLKTDLTSKEAYELYLEFYKNEKFIHVLKPGVYPSTKWSYASNHFFISFAKDDRTNTLILIGVLDNLVKGASGQAVQNMNLLFSLPEDSGIDYNPIYP
ncbi:N-acetyl-gamma-glutamyl-phosphate reductase [Pseudothermotoga sp. U03pept]|uniref:N-acetyl-gamma-glutamyl-phosphate reductase n=1 Tax=Pseudothermotoga sp. U03pept TaxID=3447012 RepID=UPI003F04E9D8